MTTFSTPNLRPSPTILLVTVLAVYGVSFTDYADFAAIAVDPFTAQADAGRQFLHSSPLFFFVGWPLVHLLGVTSAYLLTIALGLLALLVAVAAWSKCRLPEARRTALLVLLASPLTLVLTSWLGKGDAFLVAAYLSLVTWRVCPFVTFASATVMLLSHREIGTVMLVADLVLVGRLSPSILLGGIFGFSLDAAYASQVRGLALTRVGLALAFIKPAKGGWVTNPIAHVLLGLGWTWLFVVRELERRPGWRLPIVVTLTYVAAFTTADFTRVATLCSVPLVVHLAGVETDVDRRCSAASSLWLPALALLQMQVLSFDQVRDSELLRHVVETLHGQLPF